MLSLGLGSEGNPWLWPKRSDGERAMLVRPVIVGKGKVYLDSQIRL